jgi:hypothetical protein
VQGVPLIKNPGSIRLDIKDFTYELHYALLSDDFSRQIAKDSAIKNDNIKINDLPCLLKRSWLKGWDYMYLDPGERSRLSFLASLPEEVTMVVVHCEFIDTNADVELVTKAYTVPSVAAKSDARHLTETTEEKAPNS